MARGLNASGSTELNYTFRIDTADAHKKGDNIMKMFRNINAAAGNMAGFDSKSLTGYQQAQIALKKTLVESQNETEKLRQESVKYRNELELGKVAQQANKTELERLRAAEQALKNDLQQGKIAQQAYRTEVDRNRVAQQALTATLAQGKIDQQNLRAEITRITLARKQEVEAARQARKAAQEVSGSYNEAQKKLRELGNEIKSAENGYRRLTPELKAKIKEYNELNDALKRFDATMGNHQRNVGNYRGALRGTAEDLLSFASGYLSAGAALSYVFNQTLAFQRLRTPLTFILGSEGAADAKLAELHKFADEIGVEYFSIANSYKQFTAAAKASNFDLRDSEKIFRSVAKAGAVLGLSNDTLEGTFLALQQMISKGTVQSEELRGQLSERLPGAFALAAKAMGVTEAELGKLLKAGEVTANEMLPKLALELDKTYGDKAKDGIHGLNSELNQLKTETQSFAGEGSFLDKNLFQPIVRGAKEAVKGLRELFRGDGIMDFLKNATTFTGKEFRDRQNFYDLRDQARNTNSSLAASQKIDYSSQNLKELRNSYQEADIAYKKTVKSLLDYNEKSKTAGTDLKEEYKDQILALKNYASGYRAERQRIGQAIDESKKKQISVNKEILDNDLTSITSIQKRIAELKKLAGSAIAGSDVFNRIQVLQDKLKKPGLPKYEAEETGQRSLQKQIDDAIATSQRKQVDANTKEVLEVKKKYADLRKAAADHNKEVDDYNNSVANKNKRKKNKVDTSGLNQAESAETDFVVDKGKADELKIDLDKKKKLYDDYENYRTKVGKEKADQRYKDLIDVDKNYRQYLDSVDNKLTGIDDTGKGANGGGEKITQQLALLKKEREATIAEETKKYQDLLTQLVSYEEEKSAMTETYERNRAQLLKDGKIDEVKMLDKINTESMAKFEDENIEKLNAFRELFNGIEDLSADAAKRVISNGKALLDGLIAKGIKISPELKKEIETALIKSADSLESRIPTALKSIGSEIQSIASQVGEVDSGFGMWLSSAGGLLSSFADIKDQMLTIKNLQKGDALGGITAGLGLFGSVMNITKIIGNLFNSAGRAQAEQAKYSNDLQAKQNDAVIRALDRQLALINQVYGTEKITKYVEAVKNIGAAADEVRKQLSGMYKLTGDKIYDDIITKLNNGETIAHKLGSEWDNYQKLIKSGRLQNVNADDLSDLQKLIDSGTKLDAKTAALAQSLIDLKNKAIEADNAIKETLTGTSFETFADSIVDLFAKGNAAASDFGKNFEDIMKKAILNSFKTKTIATQLQGFYDQFASLSETGGKLTDDEIKLLKAKYDTIIKEGQAKFDDLQKVAGVSFLDNSSTSSSNAISRAQLTEDTGSRLEGILRSQFDYTKKIENNTAIMVQNGVKMFKAAMDNFAELQAINANTYRTANNTERLASIEKGIDTIAANTKPTVTPRGQGI